jgi:hypothetical protein
MARAGQDPVRLTGPAGRGRLSAVLARGDLHAGVTVAAYLVSQVMAYAAVTSPRPAVGLWAAVPAAARGWGSWLTCCPDRPWQAIWSASC